MVCGSVGRSLQPLLDRRPVDTTCAASVTARRYASAALWQCVSMAVYLSVYKSGFFQNGLTNRAGFRHKLS